MTPATEADRPWIEARLRARLSGSMFPLTNLREHGWDSGAARSMRFWIDRRRGAVLGVSREGMLMPQVPDHGFNGVGPLLGAQTIMGAAGEADQVRALLAELGLGGRDAKLDDDEPQFLLDMGDLCVPEGPGRLVPLSDVDRSLIEGWRRAYLMEISGEDADSADEIAHHDIERYTARDSHRVLLADDGPLSMTGFNARLPEMVQIGGVYTPPDLRGQGHARRAVALHLLEARAEGVTAATLFAAGPSAVRAYEAIGFKRIGNFALVLFREPAQVTP